MRSTAASTSSSAPSIAELREVTQPASVTGRASSEHWSGRLYMRRLSPYVTRLLLGTPLSANAVTWLMIPVGVLAALSLSLPGLAAAAGAVVLIQLQQLLDCCDGEMARWRGTFSPAGIYLDRMANHVTMPALAVALGVRADGGWGSIDGWTTVGLVIAVLVLLIMAETHLVKVARAEAGLELVPDTAAVAAPSPPLLHRARRMARYLPFFRAFVPVEASLLALAAAVGDAISGDLQVSRFLLVALVICAIVTVAGHLTAIMASQRLR
jgi:phosphatidylglycerophosphate synthase